MGAVECLSLNIRGSRTNLILKGGACWLAIDQRLCGHEVTRNSEKAAKAKCGDRRKDDRVVKHMDR